MPEPEVLSHNGLVREAIVFVAAIALPGCLLGDTDGAPRPPQEPRGPTYEKVITFAQPLDNKVVAIRLDRDADLAAHAHDGIELRVDAPYAPVGWELERLDADGTLALWARLPFIVTGQVTSELRLRYGGGASSYGADPIWAEAVGVWHLSDDAAPYRDSSPRDHVGTPVSEPMPVAGIAGTARELDGVDDAIVFDNSDGAMNVEYPSFTYSAWVDLATPAKASEVAFTKRDARGGGYELDAVAGAIVSDGVMSVTASFGTPVTDCWVFLAAVVDRQANELRTYVDGVLTDTRDITGLDAVHGDGDAHTGIGTSAFRGALDELRVEQRVVDAAELRRQYLSLAQPDLVYSVGPEQLVTP